MKDRRYNLSQIILPCLLIVIFTQGIKSQTTLKLDVVQPSVLTVNAGTDVSIDVDHNTIIGGTPTASGGTGNLTYNWTYPEYLSNGAIANPVAQPPGNVKFKVTVLDERGCTTIDEILVTVIGGTSVNEVDAGSILQIYPNPTSGIFTISLGEVKSPEIQIMIINMSGQVVYKNIIKNAYSTISTDIDISDLSRGSYFLYIYGDLESIYRQIILK